MDEDEARRRVTGAPVARLATLDSTGRPTIVPICFVVDGDTLYTAVDEKPKTTRRLQRLRDRLGEKRAELANAPVGDVTELAVEVDHLANELTAAMTRMERRTVLHGDMERRESE